MPEVMNPDALPQPGKNAIETSTTTTGANPNQLIGVSIARDGAVYRTTKKKLKTSSKQAAASKKTDGEWANY